MEKGRWAEACPLFAEAHRLQKDAIGITLNLADCYAKTGKTASAWSAYREGEFLAKKAGESERVAYAHDKAAALEPRLSHLRIDASPTPGLIIHRDDQEVGKGILGTSFPVDPGPHRIEATAPGYLVWSTTLTIGPERDEKTVTIPALGKASGGEDGGFTWTGRRMAGLGVGIAGVAGLAVGAVFGVRALGQNSDSKSQCQPQNPSLCSASGASLYHDAVTSAHVSTAALLIGGAATLAGVVLLALPGSKPPAAAARFQAFPFAGPGTGGLAARAVF